MPPIIAVTQGAGHRVERYAECVRDAGGEPRVVPMADGLDIAALLGEVDGLLLTGGADVGPEQYGQQLDPKAGLEVEPERDRAELPLVRAALERDLPILGICRGMQALNVAMGGSLIQDIPKHRASDDGKSAVHEVFVPPGSRLVPVLGFGGFMKVNSRHHQGLALAQKAPGLLVSAFSLKDGILEAIDSPRDRHRWVIGVQWHPERREELSSSFQRLFEALVEAAKTTRAGR